MCVYKWFMLIKKVFGSRLAPSFIFKEELDRDMTAVCVVGDSLGSDDEFETTDVDDTHASSDADASRTDAPRHPSQLQVSTVKCNFCM